MPASQACAMKLRRRRVVQNTRGVRPVCTTCHGQGVQVSEFVWSLCFLPNVEGLDWLWCLGGGEGFDDCQQIGRGQETESKFG
ncbi:hypothetical protein CBM2637_A60071 [Cupriavidus taiwanensis]|nr:hypothetical protein CBM2637_A60071 [Cupriavidus taiwanensis]